MKEIVCPKNIEHVVMRSERYDAWACLECNKWLESKCKTKNCGYCKDRPEKPN